MSIELQTLARNVQLFLSRHTPVRPKPKYENSVATKPSQEQSARAGEQQQRSCSPTETPKQFDRNKREHLPAGGWYVECRGISARSRVCLFNSTTATQEIISGQATLRDSDKTLNETERGCLQSRLNS